VGQLRYEKKTLQLKHILTMNKETIFPISFLIAEKVLHHIQIKGEIQA